MNAGKEIALLKHMTVTELRARYAEAFGEETRSRHKVFLVKRIAWRPGEAVTENNGRLALSVFDFSQNFAGLWRCSNFASRRAILGCVSSNRLLSDTSLVLVKRGPFDFLLERLFLNNVWGERR